MRVIAGRFKGRRLKAPREGVRPTSDRVRERLFAVLGSFDGGTAIDLFCGAGTLGIEALSRGADRLICVDRDAAVLRVLQGNLAPLREAGLVIDVIKRDAARFVRDDWPEGPIEWIFLDPPYGDTGGTDCLAAIGELDPARLGWVVWEGPGDETVDLPALVKERVLEFGDTRITLLRGGLHA